MPPAAATATAPPQSTPLLWRALSVLVHAFVALTLWRAWAPLAALGYLALVGVFRAWARRRWKGVPSRTLHFTRDGKYLVAITLGVGFAAINTGNNLLYLVLGMLLSMIIVSGVLSEQTLRRLSVRRELPRLVYAGRPFLTGISLTNHKRKLPSFSVQVEDVIDGRPLAKKCYFLKVPAGARQHTSYRAEFERRGRYVYEALQVGTRFPFAFFVKSRRYAEHTELVVLPRILPLARLSVEAKALMGTAPRPRRGSGREYHGLRGYRPGDDARDIHWKRSAREGRFLLREYESEASTSVTVLLNPWLPPGEAPTDATHQELDRCVDLAASLLFHFAERGFDVELRIGPERHTIGTEGRGLHGALRALAVFEFVPQPPGATSLRPARGDSQWVLVTHRRARSLCAVGAFALVLEQG